MLLVELLETMTRWASKKPHQAKKTMANRRSLLHHHRSKDAYKAYRVSTECCLLIFLTFFYWEKDL